MLVNPPIGLMLGRLRVDEGLAGDEWCEFCKWLDRALKASYGAVESPYRLVIPKSGWGDGWFIKLV